MLDRIEKALAAGRRGDAEARWDQVRALHREGSAAIHAAAVHLTESGVAAERALGAGILSQLGGSGPTSPFRAESAPVLARLLQDADVDVLSNALIAHGHLQLVADAELLARLVTHADTEVRFALAVALPHSGGALAVPLLLRMLTDTDDEVRNWATFGLGSQTSEDSAEIREALLLAAEDRHAETRGEALVGLAQRRDPRVLPLLEQELGAALVGPLALEAARDLAAAELVPALEALAGRWDVDEALRVEALEACRR
jgi:HEAT repeat protein